MTSRWHGGNWWFTLLSEGCWRVALAIRTYSDRFVDISAVVRDQGVVDKFRHRWLLSSQVTDGFSSNGHHTAFKI